MKDAIAVAARLGKPGIACAAGTGLEAVAAALAEGRSPGMIPTDRYTPGRTFTVGMVEDALPSLEGAAPGHRSRNNALALFASRQIEEEIRSAREEFGAGRVAVIIGTTTSGIGEAEAAFAAARELGRFPGEFAYAQMEMGSPAEFLAAAWGLEGPAYSVSTACSSSAKALASARRLLRLGACDAVLAGGVDTLCGFTLRGFASLGATSAALTAPFTADRDGINIGEAAACFVLRRDRGPVALLGVGETSDAYNISAPAPDGDGALRAMREALRDSGLEPGQVDYVNLHGTGTAQNDIMEARAMRETFPGGVPCSSTKPLTGHTLGAAGALEAAVCWATLTGALGAGRLPPQLESGRIDPEIAALGLDFARPGRKPGPPPRHAMSNVFGFGGTNVSLILGAP